MQIISRWARCTVRWLWNDKLLLNLIVQDSGSHFEVFDWSEALDEAEKMVGTHSINQPNEFSSASPACHPLQFDLWRHVRKDLQMALERCLREVIIYVLASYHSRQQPLYSKQVT